MAASSDPRFHPVKAGAPPADPNDIIHAMKLVAHIAAQQQELQTRRDDIVKQLSNVNPADYKIAGYPPTKSYR